MDTFAIGCGLAGALMNLVWPRFPSRRGMLLGQVGVSVFFLAHFALIGATTGALMNALAMAQALLAIPLGQLAGFRIAYLATLPVIAAALAASWSGVPSMFAALGFGLVSLGRYQLSPIRFRVLLLTAVLPWVGHNLSVGSFPGLVSDACAFLAGAAALRNALRTPAPATPA